MLRSRLFHGCLLVLAVGCRDVLGINEAEFNPGYASTGGSTSNGGHGNGGTESASGGSENAAGDAGATSDSDGGTAPSDGGDPGTNTTNGGEAGESGSDDPPPLCQTYCATITQNCSGDFAQYPDFDTCLAVCAALPEGWDDSGSNTVQCRLSQAKKATGDQAFYYCPQAGPSGGGECGWICDGFCTLMMAFCTSQNTAGLHYYPSIGACKQDCRNLPQDDDAYSVTTHSTGPHLQCRLFHATTAPDDPASECASALGGSPCEIPE